MLRWLSACCLAVCVCVFCGCEDAFDADSLGGESENVSEVADAASADTSTSSGGDTGDTAASDVATETSVSATSAGVVWLHHDVSGWAQTASLSVSVSGDTIRLDSDKTDVWPAKIPLTSTPLNANAWIFVRQNGTWYAGTWEWLQPGQTSKAVSAVNGKHIGASPLTNFSPQSGAIYGFMVSGLARNSTRNVYERSNVVMVRWP